MQHNSDPSLEARITIAIELSDCSVGRRPANNGKW
jgi:hypothetical protein